MAVVNESIIDGGGGGLHYISDPEIDLYVYSPSASGRNFYIKTNINSPAPDGDGAYFGDNKIYNTGSIFNPEGFYRGGLANYGKYHLGKQSSITIYGMNGVNEGYACWSIARSLEIISDSDTKITSELGFVPQFDDDDSKPLKLKVSPLNTASKISIAVYTRDSVPFWIRTNRLQEFRIGTNTGSGSARVGGFSWNIMPEEDFYPCFFPYSAVDQGIGVWFLSTIINPETQQSYQQVQYAYNTNYKYAYPSQVETRRLTSAGAIGSWENGTQLTEQEDFNNGIHIKPHKIPWQSGLYFPLWIYIFGLDSKETWDYDPAKYESKIYVSLKAFTPRTTVPSKNNLYYTRRSEGGYNPCIPGNAKHKASSANGVSYPAGRLWPSSVLPNCVGYATGRFNEIGMYNDCKYLGNRNATDFVDFVKSQGLEWDTKNPSLGACLVWGGYTVKEGHVAICEAIYDDGSIDISESGWYSTPHFRYRRVYPPNWGMSAGFYFKGFIKNPARNYAEELFDSQYMDAAFGIHGNDSGYSVDQYWDNGIATGQSVNQRVQIDDTITVIEKQEVGSVSNIHGLQLLTTPTLVESPFIEAKIGNYTFGSYTRRGTVEREYSEQRVTYPNYMESLNITKTNGAVNQYVLNMRYQIQAGEDPNLMDKVFSSVSDSRKITLTYGDWCAPEFVYRNEEAIITKVTSNVDFQHSCITYNVYCTSSALSLKSKVYDFPAYNDKPSNIIRKFLRNNSYGLLDIFYGMRNNLDKALSMIASDDKTVSIKSQENVDILTYLNYLVSCMISNSNQDVTIQDAMYNLIIRDEITGELEGPYFKVVKVNATSRTLTSTNIYEVDIGFPGETIVTDFRINNDNSWAILYNYDGAINPEEYVYRIDNEGRMRTEYSPNITTSDYYRQTTAANKTWWTRMTQFPITATLTIKGLIRPAMLMEQVRINAYFFGQRHISSGLYVITKQQDTLNSSGYKTTLTLLRVAGDEDKLYDIKQTTVTRSSLGNKVGQGSSGGGPLNSGKQHIDRNFVMDRMY